MMQLDQRICLIGIILVGVASVALIALNVFQPISLCLMLILTLVLYLAQRDRFGNVQLVDRGRPPRSLDRFQYLALIAVIAVFFLSLFLIIVSENVGSRPLWVLVLLLFPVFLALVQVILKIYRYKGGEVSILLQVLMASAAIIISSLIVYPYNGSDTWAHIYNADLVGRYGSFDVIEAGYQNYPLFPVLISFVTGSTGLATAGAARIVVILFSLVSLLLFYAMTKEYYGSAQRGLLAALVLMGSKWFLYWSTLVVSMTAVIILFTAFYALLASKYFSKREEASHSTTTILYLLFATIAPFFHPVGSVAIALLCVAFFLVGGLIFRMGNRVEYRNLLIVSFFVIIVTVTQWIFYGQTFTIAMRSLLSAIFEDTPHSISLGSSKSDPLTYFLDNVNFFLLLCMAVMETLRQVRFKTDPLVLFSGITGMVFVAFAFLTQIINLQAVLPYRWLLFGTILLILPATNVLEFLLRGRRLITKVFVTLGFLIYVFLGFGNKDVNRDHPLIAVESTQRYEISFSEYAGLRFTEGRFDDLRTIIRVDFRMWDYLKYQMDNPYLGYWNQYSLPERTFFFSYREAYAINRDSFLGSSIDDYDPTMQNMNLFYDAGDIKWLEWVYR